VTIDLNPYAAQLNALHLELRSRAERTGTTASVTLALVSRPTGLGWAAPRCPVAQVVANSAAVVRRRVAADLRAPASAGYDGRLVGVLRHRTGSDGVAMTVALLLDGTAFAFADGAALSLAVGDWRSDPDAWPVPFELAEALAGVPAARYPVDEFASRLGLDPMDADGFTDLCAQVVARATGNPTLAAAAGMDAATAAILDSLVAGPADLSDLLTGRFDPWDLPAQADLSWPRGAELLAGAR
jgi:hypothetical protein